MTAVYLFSEALNAAQIFAIYQLGLGYKVLAVHCLTNVSWAWCKDGWCLGQLTLGYQLYIIVTRGTIGKSEESKGCLIFWGKYSILIICGTLAQASTLVHTSFLLMMSYLGTANFLIVAVIKSKYYVKVNVIQEMRMKYKVWLQSWRSAVSKMHTHPINK